MPSGAGQLSSGGGQGRGAGAATAEPSWVAERPRRRDPGAVGPPSAWSPGAGMSGRRPGRLLPCPPRPGPPWDVRPTGRADIQHPRVRCPGVRCPRVRCPRVRCLGVRCISGVRTDRPAVSAALPPRCPRRAGSGVARCGGPPGWAQRVDVPRGRRAAWSPACIGPDQKGRGRRWPWLARIRVDRSQGRRLAGVPAAGPPGRRADTGAGQARCRPGGGGARDRAGAHRPLQASWAGRRRGARPWAWARR
jgi:hypothetical protein